MKAINFKKILAVTAVASLTVGCTNLDVDVKSQYTEFPNTPQALEAASADIYNACRGTQNWFVNTMASDEAVAVCFGNDWYDGGQYAAYVLHKWTPNTPWLDAVWNGYMKGVTSSNIVLAMINDNDSDAAAQVRAMRAYFYFFLMDNFGDVPIVDGFTEARPDRNSRADVAKFVEKELLSVMDKLPTNVDATTYGKPTKYMAQALLAKLYLNWAVYTASDITKYEPDDKNEKLDDAVRMCDEVMKSGKYDLSDDFIKKFLPNNGPQIKDFIFAIPYDRNTQQGMVYGRYWVCRSSQKQFGDLPQSVGGLLRVMPEFYAKFNLPGDERNDIWLKGKQYYWENYQETDRPFTIKTSKRGIDQDYKGADADDTFEWQLEFTPEVKLRGTTQAELERLDCGNDQKGRCMGYRSRKFMIDPDMTEANGRNQSNDVPVLRLADVILMKAEAILRGAKATNDDTPASLVNLIRDYVHAPRVDKNPTLDELLDERAREFTDEAWRRNDLIRFGQFEKPWGFKYLNKNNTDKHLRVYPVPTVVMNVNTHWKQTPGY